MALNEADTRAKLIDPVLHQRGWTEAHIKREETAGTVFVIDGKPRRQARGRMDYVLRCVVGAELQPLALALIEAKAEHLPPHHGLEQAKAYAKSKCHNVSFVYSCNGHQFVEFDGTTQLTSDPRPMEEFPTPEELRGRYEALKGFSLTSAAAKPLLMTYTGGEATRRYYQDAAIRAVLEKVAQCEHTRQPKRALLSLATGAGKTFIAVQLLKKIADAGQLRRALFICDRDELRTQGLGALQNVFGNDAAPVSTGEPQMNARVIVATYQTLEVDTDDADANFLLKHYPENYFSHIIIDECHRSAWGSWSTVLTRNSDAVQVGLTATPREFKIPAGSTEAAEDAKITANNVKYFGEAVYAYSMTQGMEDGYLAASDIQKGRVNLDATGITLADIIARNPVNAITGKPISIADLKERYEKTSFEDRILLPDRVLAMCSDLFEYLNKDRRPEQKTIVFCARDRHADEVAAALNNLYANWCGSENRDPAESFAFKCTAAGGSDHLAELRGSSKSHFIACTVDLLTTGVDVPCLRNIGFFKYVRSPIAFNQMVGRGTRLDPATGKLMFTIYDYTGATDLFGADLLVKPPRDGGEGGDGPGLPPPILVRGFKVVVNDMGRFILANVDGKAMPVSVEEYKERIAEKLVAEAATLGQFRERWITPTERREMMGRLPDAGKSPILIRAVTEMNAYDLYDVLAELGYGLDPKTRALRADAFTYKHAGWLAGLPPSASATLAALVGQFGRTGTDALESTKVFQMPEVISAGGLAALRPLGKPADILRDTKQRLFAA